MSLLSTRPKELVTAINEISDSTATQFGVLAVTYLTVGAPAMPVYELTAAMLRASACSYAATETVNTIVAN